MTIAWTQATINDMIAEGIRKQQADAAGVEDDLELQRLAEVIDGTVELRQGLLGGTCFADALDGYGGEAVVSAANRIWDRFCDAIPAPAGSSAATVEEVAKFAAGLEGRVEEIALLSDDDAPVHLSDAIDVGSLSDSDKIIHELEGERGLRDPLRDGGLSDWARAAQVRRIGLERLASGISTEEPSPPSGPVTTIRGESYGDGPTVDASMPRGFGQDVVEYDAGDRKQDFERRAALMRETGEDLRTCDEVAAGMKLPGETTPPQAPPAPSPPPTENWPTPHF